MADGVGGWSLSGVDSGEYSKQLMQLAKSAADAIEPSAEAPLDILSQAYESLTVQVSRPSRVRASMNLAICSAGQLGAMHHQSCLWRVHTGCLDSAGGRCQYESVIRPW